jgi:hypothetical protein
LREDVPDGKPKTFWPSSASVATEEGIIGSPGGCLRAQYWDWFNMPGEEITDNSLTSLSISTAIGAWVAECCKKLGIWAADEKRIWIEELNVSGRVDIIIHDWEADKLIPVEVKSTHGYHGRAGVIETTKKKPIPMPKDEHVLQLFIYMDYYFRKAQQPNNEIFDFPYGILFYIARDNGFRGQHILMLQPTGEMWDVPGTEKQFPVVRVAINGKVEQRYTNADIYRRWIEVKRYIDMKQVPPRDWTLQYSLSHLKALDDEGEIEGKENSTRIKKELFTELGDWQCSYCEYRDRCWKGISQHDLFEGVANKETPELE